MQDDWVDKSYKSRTPITINDGEIQTPLNNYTARINEVFPELVDMPIKKLKFAGTDKELLEHRIENFDKDTRKLNVLVKVPTISDGDIIYMYFNKKYF
jgi:hypothetical protein